MALIFCDSFDHYITADMNLKWTNAGGMTIGNNVGRFAGGAAWNDNNGSYTYRSLSPSLTVATFGAAVKFTGAPSSAPQSNNAFGFMSTSASQAVLGVSTVLPGFLVVGRSPNTTNVSNFPLAYGTIPINFGTWYYLELQVTSFHDTTGALSVRVNGVSDPGLSLVNVNTDNAGTGSANRIVIGGGGNSGAGVYIDDLYVRDDSTFMGDVRVSALYPNEPGSHTDFTRGGTDSGANWSQVSNVVPDSDTSINSSVAVNAIDSFGISTLPTTAGSVLGVQELIYARKTDAGVRSLAAFERSGTTETVGSTVALSTSYAYQRSIVELNPATGIPYTVAEINALEIGYKLVG